MTERVPSSSDAALDNMLLFFEVDPKSISRVERKALKRQLTEVGRVMGEALAERLKADA